MAGEQARAALAREIVRPLRCPGTARLRDRRDRAGCDRVGCGRVGCGHVGCGRVGCGRGPEARRA